MAAGLSIALASRLAVARRGLGTASRFALVRSHRSGVRFQDARYTRASGKARSLRSLVAAGLGIEPKFSLSESDGLPLADPAM